MEKGLPLVGAGLTVIDENVDISTLFEKHGNADAIYLNLGSAGWYLTVQSAEYMEDLSTSNVKNTYTQWPSALTRLFITTCALLSRKVCENHKVVASHCSSYISSTTHIMRLP